MKKHLAVLTAAILLTIVAVSCGKKGVPPDANTQPKIYVEAVSSTELTLPPKTYSSIIQIRVVNSQGLPVIGDTVTFAQISPISGSRFWFSPGTSDSLITNDQGYAYNRYQSDSTVGVDTISVTTSSLGDSGAVYFVVTVVPAEPADIVKISPLNPVSSTAGREISVPFIVRVNDRYGNPVPNSRVVYRTNERCVVSTDSMVDRPYLVDTAFTITDTAGMAQADWILTISPDPYLGTYPNTASILNGYAVYNDSRVDSVAFRAFATNPGQLEYYNDIRPILIANCQGSSCHGGASNYLVDFYYTLVDDSIFKPGDTTCSFVTHLDPYSHISSINTVEEDKAIRWAVVDSAAPGSSGLNNYTDQMKSIFDNGCIMCHDAVTPPASYNLTTFFGILGDGSDAIPNAIPGDNACKLATYMQARHNADSLSLDPTTAAALADSIVRWIVVDSLREY